MVVPYPTHAEVYAHRLFKGMKPEDEIWPAKVEGLIKLLENDVEVIDLGDAFRSCRGPGRVLGPFEEVSFAGPVDLGKRIDPVFLMGDSSVPFAGVYPKGAGIMPHLSAELGAPEQETRMIVDDTENYDAAMYWADDGR